MRVNDRIIMFIISISFFILACFNVYKGYKNNDLYKIKKEFHYVYENKQILGDIWNIFLVRRQSQLTLFHDITKFSAKKDWKKAEKILKDVDYIFLDNNAQINIDKHIKEYIDKNGELIKEVNLSSIYGIYPIKVIKMKID